MKDSISTGPEAGVAPNPGARGDWVSLRPRGDGEREPEPRRARWLGVEGMEMECCEPLALALPLGGIAGSRWATGDLPVVDTAPWRESPLSCGDEGDEPALDSQVATVAVEAN